MSTLTYNNEVFSVDHAVKGADYIHGYDANGVLIVSFDGVTDFSCFEYDGTYMGPGECLTEHCNTVRYCGGALKTLDGRWVTPPMLAGVEYRTTEYWNGNPVYTMLVDYGALPNSKEGTNYALPGGLNVIDIRGFAVGENYIVPIPGYYSVESLGYNSSSGNLWISTTRDMRSYHGYITVKYTKSLTPDADETSRLVITDDGAGNVMIYAQGNASIVDDGNGHVTIVNAGTTSITVDSSGNVTIL